MKKRLSFSEFMTHRITLSVEAVLAAFAPLLFWACRPSGHGFIDIYSFDGASQFVFWLMVADAVAVAVIAALRFRAERFEGETLPKPYRIAASVTFFVTGNGFTTLSVEIYSRARQGISLEINALSTLVFLFSLVLVVGYYFISKDSRKRRGKKRRGALLK